jgi:hypothetical protein
MNELRLECLRLAIELNLVRKTEDVLNLAERLFCFVINAVPDR